MIASYLISGLLVLFSGYVPQRIYECPSHACLIIIYFGLHKINNRLCSNISDDSEICAASYAHAYICNAILQVQPLQPCLCILHVVHVLQVTTYASSITLIISA